MWEKVFPPPDSRFDWLCETQGLPGFGWVLRAEVPPQPTLAAAQAAAAAIQVSDQFSRVCDRHWQVYRNAKTNALFTAREPPVGMLDGFFLEKPGLCCEEAFAMAFPGPPPGTDCRMALPGTAPATPTGAGLSGTFTSGASTAVLVQVGTGVTGTFIGRDGAIKGATGTVSGTFDGQTFKGTYSSVWESYRDSGSFSMTLSPDGHRLSGRWVSKSGDSNASVWTR